MSLFVALSSLANGVSDRGCNLVQMDAKFLRGQGLSHEKLNKGCDAILKEYLGKKGALSADQFPVLAPLLKKKVPNLQSLKFDELMGIIREETTALKVANNVRHATLLGDDEVRLSQKLVIAWVLANPDSTTIIDIMNRMGWNCRSMAYWTVLLAFESGVEGVSLVEVVQTPDGERYPNKDGLCHVSVLKVKPDKTAEVWEQGKEPVTKGYIVKVCDDHGNWVEKDIEVLNKSRVGWQGLTFPRMEQFQDASAAFESLPADLEKLGFCKLIRKSGGGSVMNFYNPILNAKIVAAETPKILAALKELRPKVAFNSGYAKDVTELEGRFKSFEEKASASLEDWQKYHELLKPAIEHGWITEKEGGGDFNIKGPVLTKAFLQDVGSIIVELEKFLQGNADLDLWSEANQVFKYLKKARDRVRMESVAPVQSNSDRPHS